MEKKLKTIVIAPHPDDEIFGVGGTLLRRKNEGAKTACIFVTSPSKRLNWSKEKIRQRSLEINQVSALLNFDELFELKFPSADLDQVPMSDLVAAISNIFLIFKPNEIFIPHPSDIHTDHKIVFNAAVSCSKWFRFPFVKRILTYETLSETEFGINPNQTFKPNVFINIEPYIEKKLKAISIYKSELEEFPFPRSLEAARALAMLRGSSSGFKAAEAFELLKEII